MKIELFLDEDAHSGLAHALRNRGYNAIHAQELDPKGVSDSDQLLFAIRAVGPMGRWPENDPTKKSCESCASCPNKQKYNRIHSI